MSFSIYINGNRIKPGSRVSIGVPLPCLYTDTAMAMPIHIVRGEEEGPRLFISAAVHGDELNGVEIIRRIGRLKALSRLRGTLITVPVVNVYGMIHRARNLPDGRDLNRCFPGSDTGSLASRLAECFMDEVVHQCTHGIDLHTGGLHRSNLPQIIGNLDDPETLELARAFDAPVILNSPNWDGSLRKAADELGIPTLLYEAGQALRFDEAAIRLGVKGITRVMQALGMLPKSGKRRKPAAPVVGTDAEWLRAPSGGVLRMSKHLGDPVGVDEPVAMVDDLFRETSMEILAPYDGIIIGRSEIPVVHEGDPLFHIARFRDPKGIAQTIEDHRVDSLYSHV